MVKFYKSWFDQNLIQFTARSFQENAKFLSFKVPSTINLGPINSTSTFWRLVSKSPPSQCPESEEKREAISTRDVCNLMLNKFVAPTVQTKILKHDFTP